MDYENKENKLHNTSNENNCKTLPNSHIHKLVQSEKEYEKIRGHERHILFHFFTLFMISFLIGVVLIHLSLCFSSLVYTAGGRSHKHDQDTLAATEEGSSCEEITLYEVLKRTFQYTGNYFHDVTLNYTNHITNTR